MKRRSSAIPGKAPDAAGIAREESTRRPHHAVLSKQLRQTQNRFQASGKVKDLAPVLNARRKLRRALAPGEQVELEPDYPSGEQLMRWWKEWFGGEGKGGNAGRVWRALDYNLVAIEDFLAFESFLEVDDGMAFGAWPEAQRHEAAMFRVLDELRLSLVEPRASAKGTHIDMDRMRLWNVMRHSNWPQSPCRADAKTYLRHLRASVRTLSIEQIRRAHRRFEDFLSARRSAMELLKRGPYQMPTEGPPVSSFKLFARRHAMGLITTDFFDGIPFSIFLRLTQNERRELMKCFDRENKVRKRNYHAKPDGAPPQYYKRLLAWLLDNWPVFVEHRWDWRNVFDASQEVGFKHHKTHTDLNKWFSYAGPPQKLNPDHQDWHTNSQKHLLTPAPPAPVGAS